MGIKLSRKKNRNFLLTIIYRFNKLFFFVSHKNKLKLFLDLEWIFDRLAHEETEKLFPPSKHPIRTLSLDFIKHKINENSTICDFGCKYGHISFLLAHIAKEVVGIDYDLSAINIANANYQKGNLKFIHADVFDFLNKLKQNYDAVILSHILEHIDDPEDFINQLKENFKNIYIEVPDFDKTYLNQYRLIMKNSLIYADADHVHEFDRYELKELLNKCGLSIEAEEYRFGVQKIWCTSQI